MTEPSVPINLRVPESINTLVCALEAQMKAREPYAPVHRSSAYLRAIMRGLEADGLLKPATAPPVPPSPPAPVPHTGRPPMMVPRGTVQHPPPPLPPVTKHGDGPRLVAAMAGVSERDAMQQAGLKSRSVIYDVKTGARPLSAFPGLEAWVAKREAEKATVGREK